MSNKVKYIVIETVNEYNKITQTQFYYSGYNFDRLVNK